METSIHHDIQIVIDNAGGISLKVDDWYCYFGDDAESCAENIALALEDSVMWTAREDGYEDRARVGWGLLVGAVGCDHITDADELLGEEPLGGYAGARLRAALVLYGIVSF